MLKTVAMFAAMALAAGSASAQKIDDKGKCHDASGKFAKMEVCKDASPTGPDAVSYKLDAKGNCHDAKGKMAKKGMCTAPKK
jgi:hypothetical protein